MDGPKRSKPPLLPLLGYILTLRSGRTQHDMLYVNRFHGTPRWSESFNSFRYHLNLSYLSLWSWAIKIHSYPPKKGGILSPTRLPIQITILTKRLDCFLSISCLFFFYICFLRTQWTIRCGITCWLRCACLGWFRISLSCSWASCSCSSGISCSWHKISRRSCLLLLRNF